MYACMHVCMCACMHVSIYLSIYLCLYVCMSVCLYGCMDGWMYVCMYVWLNEWMNVCNVCDVCDVCLLVNRTKTTYQKQDKQSVSIAEAVTLLQSPMQLPSSACTLEQFLSTQTGLRGKVCKIPQACGRGMFSCWPWSFSKHSGCLGKSNFTKLKRGCWWSRSEVTYGYQRQKNDVCPTDDIIGSHPISQEITIQTR